MSMFNGSVFMRIVSVVFSAALLAQSPQSASEKIAAGKRLILNNCGECIGRQVVDFDRGVKLVEEGLAALSGNDDTRRKGLLVLLDAYSELAFASDHQRMESADSKKIWRKRLINTFEDLLRDDPRNVDLLMRYGGLMETDSQALQVYSRVLELQSGNAEAVFCTASIRVSNGQVERGVMDFLRALGLESADQEMIRKYWRNMEQGLIGSGNSRYIDELSRAVAEALRKRGSEKN